MVKRAMANLYGKKKDEEGNLEVLEDDDVEANFR